MESVENLRGEIFQLYIGEDMRLEDLLNHLKLRYDLNVTYVYTHPFVKGNPA